MSNMVLFVAGDPSGDVHAGELIRLMKQADPSLKAAVVGGKMMRAQADEFLFDLATLGVTGFWEPFKRLPLFVRLFLTLKKFMLERRPAAVVCVDYYGFNRWVLKAAKDQGLKTYYYISPQVWASRAGRVNVLKEIVGRMLVIFPFEEALYRRAGVPVSFVGHPLIDRIPEPHLREGIGRLLRIGLLPGSRASEVNRHLPVFLDALRMIRRNFPKMDAVIFASSHLPDSIYESARAQGLSIVRESDYRIRSEMDLVLTSSGTATLENALLGLPMVVVYKMSGLTYLLARALIQVRYIAMANLLADRALVPELIQDEATSDKVAQASLNILSNPKRLDDLRRDLSALRQALGGPGAAARAAQIILSEINGTGYTAALEHSRPEAPDAFENGHRMVESHSSPFAARAVR